MILDTMNQGKKLPLYDHGARVDCLVLNSWRRRLQAARLYSQVQHQYYGEG